MKFPLVLFYIVLIFCVIWSHRIDAGAQEKRLKTITQVQSSIKDVANFTASVPKRSWAGEKIPLLLEVKNTGKFMIELNDDLTRTFLIHIKAKDGMFVPKTLYGALLEKRLKDSARNVIITLSPEKKASVTVDLGLLFDLTAGGYYSATIECKYNKVMKDNETIMVEGLRFTIDRVSLPNLSALESQDNRKGKKGEAEKDVKSDGQSALESQDNRKGNKGEAEKDLKSDGRLKVGITTRFIKPKVREVLEYLEKVTALRFSSNEFVEMNEEAFGSLAFRNTPAWVVMEQLAKSDAVKGKWQKSDEGYTLVGTLDEKAQDARLTLLGKAPPPVSRAWRMVVIIVIPTALIALILFRYFRPRRPSRPIIMESGDK